MAYGTTFKLEDLDLQIPQSESQNIRTKKYKSLYGGGYNQETTKSVKYTIPYVHNATLTKLDELRRNPAFALAPVYDITDRINTGALKSSSRKWGVNVSDVSLDIMKGYGKWMYLSDTHERPLNDRWKTMIHEDFTTDTDAWPADTPLSGTWNSQGVNFAATPTHQDIPWEEVTDDWATSTTADRFLTGTQSLECTGSDGIIVAGWDWWENYEVSVWFYNDVAITDDTGIIFRYQDSTNHYKFMNTDASSIGLYNNTTPIIVDTSLTLVVDTFYHMRIVVQGHRMGFYLNGEKLFDGKDIIDKNYVSGRVGLWAALNNTHFDDFRVTLLPPTAFNFQSSVDWHNQYSHDDIVSAYGTESKLVDPSNDVLFKLNVASEETPSTVFIYDYYGAVYHRVYHKTHPFQGVPYIDNGLVRIELSGTPTIPTLYAYIDSTWNKLGTILPRIDINNEGYIETWDDSEYYIEELTDQYCKLRMRYYKTSDSNIPQGTTIDMNLIIRNGYPGVLIEIDDQSWHRIQNSGFVYTNDATNADLRFFYAPDDQSQDALFTTDFGLNTTEVDDNWSILFSDYNDADSKDVILGFFGDDTRDDLGSEDSIAVRETSNRWDRVYRSDSKFGGIFIIPYTLEALFAEAEDEFDLGNHYGAVKNTAQGDDSGDSVVIESPGEYLYWEIGALTSGNYKASARIKRNSVSQNATIEIRHTTHDGTLVASSAISPTTSFVDYYISYHIDDSISGNTFFCKVTK